MFRLERKLCGCQMPKISSTSTSPVNAPTMLLSDRTKARSRQLARDSCAAGEGKVWASIAAGDCDMIQERYGLRTASAKQATSARHNSMYGAQKGHAN